MNRKNNNDDIDFVDWDSVWEKENGFATDKDSFDEVYEIALRAKRNSRNVQRPQTSGGGAPSKRKVAKNSVDTPKKKKTSKPKKARSKQGDNKQKKKWGWFKRTLFLLLVFVNLYIIVIYSQIPFIAKWRTIYIETAMSTMRYQWLATAFIPGDVIDDVMRDRYLLDENQSGLISEWDGGIGFAPRSILESDKDYFSRIFHEIDMDTFEDYADEHDVYTEKGQVMIDEADVDGEGTTIKTKQGDEILAIDEENGILITKIHGDGFVARLAIIKDPAQVKLGLCENFGVIGSRAELLVEDNGAILGINASGFVDPEGMGNGGKAYGLVISEGKLYQDIIGNANKIIAFDYRDRLNIGNYKSLSTFRDAVEFKPALIINGEKLVKGSAGWGIQPRSVIGQTERGEVLLLIVDGRAPGYSIGATLGQCADIMMSYDAVQACNLDGGSSSIMYYNGREISRPSAANKVKGRAIPNGFLVYPRK